MLPSGTKQKPAVAKLKKSRETLRSERCAPSADRAEVVKVKKKHEPTKKKTVFGGGGRKDNKRLEKGERKKKKKGHLTLDVKS